MDGVVVAQQQGLFAPRALPRFNATTGPSATLSSSPDFPVLPVIQVPVPPISGRDEEASPVAQCILVIVLSLPPRQSVTPLQPVCDVPCCLRPTGVGSASEVRVSGHLCVHFRYGPMTRS